MTGAPILIVDDSPAIRETVAWVLEDEGYPVQTAANGEEALSMIAQQHPACLLLDMRMPCLDGWGVVQNLQARGAPCPIVVMTAAHDAARWAAEIGAAAYLPKPFDIATLVATLAGITDAPAVQNEPCSSGT